MEVVDAIKNRYSVRGFLNKEVEKDTVKKIIELAKMAPSGVKSIKNCSCNKDSCKHTDQYAPK